MENLESFNNEFKYASKVQETNHVPPIDLFQTLHSSLKNDIWSAYLGRVYYEVGLSTSVKKYKKLNDGLIYKAGQQEYADASKIVNGVTVDNYNTFTNYEYDKESDSYKLDYKLSDRIEETGVVATEIDLLLHEAYRYLGWDYIDNPSYLSILTKNEATEFFRDNFVFLNIDDSELSEFEIKEQIRSVQNYKLARMLANSRYMYYIIGYVFDEVFKVIDIYSVGNLDLYDYCGFNLLNLRSDTQVDSSDTISFLVDDARKNICYENPLNEAYESSNISYYLSEGLKKYSITLVGNYNLKVKNLDKEYLYYDCDDYIYNLLADQLYNYSINEYLIQSSTQNYDEITLYSKITKDPIALQAYGDLSNFTFDYVNNSWVYDYDFTTNELYNKRISILVGTHAEQYYIKDFNRGFINLSVEEAFDEVIDKAYFDIPFILTLKYKNNEYKNLLVLVKDLKTVDAGNDGYLVDSMKLEILANVPTNILVHTDYEITGKAYTLYDIDEIRLTPYTSVYDQSIDYKNVFEGKTLKLITTNAGSFVVEDKEDSGEEEPTKGLSEASRRVLRSAMQLPITKIINQVFNNEAVVTVEDIDEDSWCIKLEDLSIFNALSVGDQVYYSGQMLNISKISNGYLQFLERKPSNIINRGVAKIFTKNNIPQKNDISYETALDEVCSFESNYNMQDYTCDVSTYNIVNAQSFSNYFAGDFWKHSPKNTPELLSPEDNILYYQEGVYYNTIMKDLIVSFISTSISYVWNDSKKISAKTTSLLNNCLSDRYSNKVNNISTFFIKKTSTFATKDLSFDYVSQSFNSFDKAENFVKYIQISNEGHKSSKMAQYLRQKENIRASVYSTSGSQVTTTYNDSALDEMGGGQAIYNDKSNLSNTLYISSLTSPIADISLSPLNSLTNVRIEGKETDLVNVVLSKSKFTNKSESYVEYLKANQVSDVVYHTYNDGVIRNHFFMCFLTESLIEMNNEYFLALLNHVTNLTEVTKDTVFQGSYQTNSGSYLSYRAALYYLASSIFGKYDLDNNTQNIYDVFFFKNKKLFRVSLELDTSSGISLFKLIDCPCDPCIKELTSVDVDFEQETFDFYQREDRPLSDRTYLQVIDDPSTSYEGYIHYETTGYDSINDFKNIEENKDIVIPVPSQKYWPYCKYYLYDNQGTNSIKDIFQVNSAEALLKEVLTSEIYTLNRTSYKNFSIIEHTAELNPLLLSETLSFVDGKVLVNIGTDNFKVSDWFNSLSEEHKAYVREKFDEIKSLLRDQDSKLLEPFNPEGNYNFTSYNFIASGEARKHQESKKVVISSPMWPALKPYLLDRVSGEIKTQALELFDDWNNSIKDKLDFTKYLVAYNISNAKYFKNLVITKGRKYQKVNTKNERIDIIKFEDSNIDDLDIIKMYSKILVRNAYDSTNENIAFSKEYTFKNTVSGLSQDLTSIVTPKTTIFESVNDLLRDKPALESSIDTSKFIGTQKLIVTPLKENTFKFYKNNVVLKGLLRKGEPNVIYTEKDVDNLLDTTNIIKTIVAVKPATDIPVIKGTEAFNPIVWCQVEIDDAPYIIIFESTRVVVVPEDGLTIYTSELFDEDQERLLELEGKDLSITSIGNTIIISAEGYNPLAFNVYLDELSSAVSLNETPVSINDDSLLPLTTVEMPFTINRETYVFNSLNGDKIPMSEFFISEVNQDDNSHVKNGVNYSAKLPASPLYIDSCRSTENQKFITLNGKGFIYNKVYNLADIEVSEDEPNNTDEFTKKYYWRQVDIPKYIKQLPAGQLAEESVEQINTFITEVVSELQKVNEELSHTRQGKAELKRTTQVELETQNRNLTTARSLRNQELARLDDIIEERARLQVLLSQIEDDGYESVYEKYLRLNTEYSEVFDTVYENTPELDNIIHSLGYDSFTKDSLYSALNYCENTTTEKDKQKIVNDFLHIKVNNDKVTREIISLADEKLNILYSSEAQSIINAKIDEIISLVTPVTRYSFDTSAIPSTLSCQDVIFDNNDISPKNPYTMYCLCVQGFKDLPHLFNGAELDTLQALVGQSISSIYQLQLQYTRGAYGGCPEHRQGIEKNMRSLYVMLSEKYTQILNNSKQEIITRIKDLINNSIKSYLQQKDLTDIRSLNINELQVIINSAVEQSAAYRIVREYITNKLYSQISGDFNDTSSLAYEFKEAFLACTRVAYPHIRFYYRAVTSYGSYYSSSYTIYDREVLECAKHIGDEGNVRQLHSKMSIYMDFIRNFYEGFSKQLIMSFMESAQNSYLKPGVYSTLFIEGNSSGVKNNNPDYIEVCQSPISQSYIDYLNTIFSKTYSKNSDILSVANITVEGDGSINPPILPTITEDMETLTPLDMIYYNQVREQYDRVIEKLNHYNDCIGYRAVLRATDLTIQDAKARLDVASQELYETTNQMHKAIQQFGDVTKLNSTFRSALEDATRLVNLENEGPLSEKGNVTLINNVKIITEALTNENSPFHLLASVNETIENHKQRIDELNQDIFNITNEISALDARISKNNRLIDIIQHNEFNVLSFDEFKSSPDLFIDLKNKIVRLPAHAIFATDFQRDTYGVDFCLESEATHITFEGKNFDTYLGGLFALFDFYLMYIYIYMNITCQTINLGIHNSNDFLTIRNRRQRAISAWNTKGLSIISPSAMLAINEADTYKSENFSTPQKWKTSSIPLNLYIDEDVTSTNLMKIIVDDIVYDGPQETKRHFFFDITEIESDANNIFLFGTTKTQTEIKEICEAINASYRNIGGANANQLDISSIISAEIFSEKKRPIILYSDNGGESYQSYVYENYAGQKPGLVVSVEGKLLVQMIANNISRILKYDLTTDRGIHIIPQGPEEVVEDSEIVNDILRKMEANAGIDKFDNILFDPATSEALFLAKSQNSLRSNLEIEEVYKNEVMLKSSVINKLDYDLDIFFIANSFTDIVNPYEFINREDIHMLNPQGFNLITSNTNFEVRNINECNGVVIPLELKEDPLDEYTPPIAVFKNSTAQNVETETDRYITYFIDDGEVPIKNKFGNTIKVWSDNRSYTNVDYSSGKTFLEGNYQECADCYELACENSRDYFAKEIELSKLRLKYDGVGNNLEIESVEENLGDLLKNTYELEPFLISKYEYSLLGQQDFFLDYLSSIEETDLGGFDKEVLTVEQLLEIGEHDNLSYNLHKRFIFTPISADGEVGQLYDNYTNSILLGKNITIEIEDPNNPGSTVTSYEMALSEGSGLSSKNRFLYTTTYEGKILIDAKLHKVENFTYKNTVKDGKKYQEILSPEVISYLYFNTKGYGAAEGYSWSDKLIESSTTELRSEETLPWNVDGLAFNTSHNLKNELGDEVLMCNLEGEPLTINNGEIKIPSIIYKSNFDLLNSLGYEITESNLMGTESFRLNQLDTTLIKTDDGAFLIDKKNEEDNIENGEYLFYVLTKKSIPINTQNFKNKNAFIEITDIIDTYEPDRVYQPYIKSPIIQNDESILYFNNETLEQEDYIDDAFSIYGYTEEIWFNLAGNNVYACDEFGIPYVLEHNEETNKYRMALAEEFSSFDLIKSLSFGKNTTINQCTDEELTEIFITDDKGKIKNYDKYLFDVRARGLGEFGVLPTSTYFMNNLAVDFVLTGKKDLNILSVSLRYNKDQLAINSNNNIQESFSFDTLEFDEIGLFNSEHLIVGYILLNKPIVVDMEHGVCSLLISAQ